MRLSLPASPDSPILRARDPHSGDATEPLRVLLVGSHAIPVGPVDATNGRRVEVVGCADTVDQAASMAELYRPDVVVVTGNGTPGGLPLDLVQAVLRLACAAPDGA